MQNLNVPNGSFDIVSGFEIILIIWSFEFVSDFDIRISDLHNLFLRDNFGQRLLTFLRLSAGFGSIFRLFLGLLKKAASCVLIARRAQRTQRTPRPPRCLRPCWTAFLNSPGSYCRYRWYIKTNGQSRIFQLFNRPFLSELPYYGRAPNKAAPTRTRVAPS